ncbi:hypothetical protein F0562_007583 [Nyssa sinensis]|uniref:Uncharacterized protein n=1 Tax=Nyssa sinensis TaxID=561372 RepID=A0A5J5A6U0_9ASTE|nr:hypothetical protein F0562_007583 [Nyssa sinensis]
MVGDVNSVGGLGQNGRRRSAMVNSEGCGEERRPTPPTKRASKSKNDSRNSSFRGISLKLFSSVSLKLFSSALAPPFPSIPESFAFIISDP